MKIDSDRFMEELCQHCDSHIEMCEECLLKDIIRKLEEEEENESE